MKRSIFTTLFGTFVFVLYLVLSIQSYSKYDDGFGTDYSFDMDLFVLCICGFIILVIGLYDLYTNLKNKDINIKKIYTDGIILLGAITTMYPLGMMFKSIAKKKGGSVISSYLECAIFGGFVLTAGILYFIDNKKKQN